MEPHEVAVLVLSTALELATIVTLAQLMRMRLSSYTAALRSCLGLELVHVFLTMLWLFVHAEADRAAGASAAADAALAAAGTAGLNTTAAALAAQDAARTAMTTRLASNSVRVSAGVCDGLSILLFVFAELDFWEQIAPFAPGITVAGVRWGKALLYTAAPFYVATAFKPVVRQPFRQWMFIFEVCATFSFGLLDVAQSLHLLHVVFRRIRNVSSQFQINFALVATFAALMLVAGAALHGVTDNILPLFQVLSDLTIPAYMMSLIGTMQVVRAALADVLPRAVRSAIGSPEDVAAVAFVSGVGGRGAHGAGGRGRGLERHRRPHARGLHHHHHNYNTYNNQSNQGFRNHRNHHHMRNPSVAQVARVIFEGADPTEFLPDDMDGNDAVAYMQAVSGLTTFVQKGDDYSLSRGSVLMDQSIRMSVLAGQSTMNSFVTLPPAAMLDTDTAFE
ncbi:hypothetical protein HK105_208953 [Polyrhizophydium stewartii]|uniref:Uncharacterized protein n=1 Tax=Polyrhizophydium stewartii TaxID=2732419 RepID=A0ABR4MWC0_9FUNG|nr:hypothetical protein HK105_004215 [Polyrhizophydium stewartii]